MRTSSSAIVERLRCRLG